jgi:diguanylate cyclase (GGDEF)-like protein
VVERVRKAVEEAEIEIGAGVALRFTGSFGLSEYSPDKDMTAIFRQADEALYHAKNSGRNQVRIACSEA